MRFFCILQPSKHSNIWQLTEGLTSYVFFLLCSITRGLPVVLWLVVLLLLVHTRYTTSHLRGVIGYDTESHHWYHEMVAYQCLTYTTQNWLGVYRLVMQPIDAASGKKIGGIQYWWLWSDMFLADDYRRFLTWVRHG
jgi:hypothetical protein